MTSRNEQDNGRDWVWEYPCPMNGCDGVIQTDAGVQTNPTPHLYGATSRTDCPDCGTEVEHSTLVKRVGQR